MFSSEKNLLRLIKIIPITVIILFSIIATYFAINENRADYNKQLEELKSELKEEAKQRIKEEVLRVYNAIKFEKNTTREQLKDSIKQRVYEAHAVLTKIYNENKTKSDLEIKKMMKDALNDIRFNSGRGYYFIYEMNGTNVLLPPNKSLEGTSFWNFKDAKGIYTIRGMSNIVKQLNEGFYKWYWYKPGDKNTQYEKIGFGKHFEPFNWFIGTGEYIKDFESDIKKHLLKRINTIRYDKNGYIFVNEFSGVTLAHINKNIIGKNNIDLKDATGVMLVQKIIDIAKEGEGFFQYVNTTHDGHREKISFIKGIDEWQWAIGSGIYVEELNEQVLKRAEEIKQTHQTSINRILLFSVSLTIVFLVLSIVMSQLVKRIFYSYKVSVAKRDQQLAEQAKLVAMGEMIGNIAHQWRQPLSVISTASTGMSIQQQANVLKEEDVHKLCDTINENAQYLSKTIDDFTNFIKGDRSKVKFNLIDSIDSFLHLLEGTIKNNNIEVHINKNHPVELYGYPNELIQCIINIFNNAKDVLKQTKSKRYFFIDIIEENDEKIVISLKDNAGGIPNNVIPRVFEPYYTTKHKSQGTGLGLSMTYNLIVNGMNGEVYVKNSTYDYEGQEYTGAEFIITLPVS